MFVIKWREFITHAPAITSEEWMSVSYAIKLFVVSQTEKKTLSIIILLERMLDDPLYPSEILWTFDAFISEYKISQFIST